MKVFPAGFPPVSFLSFHFGLGFFFSALADNPASEGRGRCGPQMDPGHQRPASVVLHCRCYSQMQMEVRRTRGILITSTQDRGGALHQADSQPALRPHPHSKCAAHSFFDPDRRALKDGLHIMFAHFQAFSSSLK